MTTKEPLSAKGKIFVAEAYLQAAVAVYKHNSDNPVYALAPVLHMCGLAAELTLKAILADFGVDEEELRRTGHNLSELLEISREHIDIDRAVNTVWATLRDLPVPAEIRERMEAAGEEDIDLKWKYFPAQLDLLNELYDRPYFSRYPTSGAVTIPDAWIVLVGIDALRHEHFRCVALRDEHLDD